MRAQRQGRRRNRGWSRAATTHGTGGLGHDVDCKEQAGRSRRGKARLSMRGDGRDGIKSNVKRGENKLNTEI